jgi:hypothetical protein
MAAPADWAARASAVLQVFRIQEVASVAMAALLAGIHWQAGSVNEQEVTFGTEMAMQDSCQCHLARERTE